MWTSRTACIGRSMLCTMNNQFKVTGHPSYSVLAVLRASFLKHRCTLLPKTFFTITRADVQHVTDKNKAAAELEAVSDGTLASGYAETVSTDAHTLDSDLSSTTHGRSKTTYDMLPSADNQIPIETSQPSDTHPQSTLSPTDKAQLPAHPHQASTPPLKSHSLAPYVAASVDLQRLAALGVDVSSWDRRPGIPQMVLRLSWEADIAPRIRFLHDAGVPVDRLAAFITRNPLIFKERIDDLQVRLNYLAAKRFSREQIASVVCRDPFWLMFNTMRIDRRLGLFMGLFGLEAQELRQLAVKRPSLITSNLQHVKDLAFTIKEEFGFQRHELKQILLQKPKVLMLSRSTVQNRLHFLHNEIGLSHQAIADEPTVLTYRSWRVRQRHLMLNMLNRDQYDRTRPGYVSLDRLVGTTDQEFCRDIAQVPVASYNEFLKTL